VIGLDVSATESAEALVDLARELRRRLAKHGPGAYVDAHHALGVIVEEMAELTDAIRANDERETIAELFDVAVGAVFAVASLRARRRAAGRERRARRARA
jgi:NTP pyrophosphatase (non-canonical NTP hydrolase)